MNYQFKVIPIFKYNMKFFHDIFHCLYKDIYVFKYLYQLNLYVESTPEKNAGR